MKYKILEHRADLKIRVFGKTKEELFSNALFGMSESMKPEIKQKQAKTATREIKISSFDSSSLLVDFLNEVLYLSQTNKEIYFQVKFKKFSENEIKGELLGRKVERFDQDIKATTYHGVDIKQNPQGVWQTYLVFDI